MDAEDNDGNQILHYAFQRHSNKPGADISSTLKFLLSHGADVDARNSQGMTTFTTSHCRSISG